jgi:hypothetical protein
MNPATINRMSFPKPLTPCTHVIIPGSPGQRGSLPQRGIAVEDICMQSCGLIRQRDGQHIELEAVRRCAAKRAVEAP